MPELPEVETARRLSEQYLVGRTIRDIDLTLPKVLRDSPIPTTDVLLDATMVASRRRAKVMTLDFANNVSLMVHFKLAGQWAIFLPDGGRFVAGHPVPKPEGEYPHKSTHATMSFDDGTIVRYSDIRQFGWWRIMPTEDVEAAVEAFGFGPEATGELDASALAGVMARRGIPIKTLLLDQSFIAGLGNIYVDEVLWRSRIHPATPAKAISTVKQRQIIRQIPDVMAEGIHQGGAKIIHNIAYPENDFPSIHAREGRRACDAARPSRKHASVPGGRISAPNAKRHPLPANNGNEKAPALRTGPAILPT